MSLGVGAKKRLGVGGGGFALGCGCKDAKAVEVAVAVASASPYSATTTGTSTATTATWRRARATNPSASGSTGTLTVPSAPSSSFLWEDVVEAEGDEEEVNCKRLSSATTTSFSGLLRQLNDLEQSVVSWGRKSTSKSDYSPPPPPPPPSRPVKHRVVHSGDRRDSKEGHGNFSPPAPPPSFQFQSQQHRKAKSMDKGDGQEEEVHSMQPPPPPSPLPLPAEQLPNVKSMDIGSKKEDVNNFPPSQVPKHRKTKSCDGGTVRLDGSVAVVKQSEDPLSDFRRSMANMIVENRIVTGDELHELLRHFLALNAPHHHDAILRAFTEIWDEALTTKTPQRKPARPAPKPPRQKASPRRRQPPRAWR
ncbi:transcription repressor OFP8-like [Phragmites australis]|uniref:transcription repressor OFP8-like n=1 Tax=Phragmites australis TaxID=29695 RepID=UPI002D7794FF|nr:transcription repressor OFP8-like [Phragmites australis]